MCCVSSAYGAEARQQLGSSWIAAPRPDRCSSDTPTLVTHFLSFAHPQRTSSFMAMVNARSVFFLRTPQISPGFLGSQVRESNGIHSLPLSLPTYLIFSAMLHLESQMPLSPWRPSFGTASADCVNTCSGYHFSLGTLSQHDWPEARTGPSEGKTNQRTTLSHEGFGK